VSEKKEERKEKPIVIKYPVFKEVYVFERTGDLVIPKKARYDTSSGMLTTEDNHVYVVPDDYRPLLFYKKKLIGKQAVLAFLADPATGTLVKWERDVNASGVNARFLGSIINSKLLEKLAGSMTVKISDIVSWLLAGLGVGFIVIFIVFPVLGIHVSIGAQPINVYPQVQINPIQTITPPPGNYTITGPMP